MTSFLQKIHRIVYPHNTLHVPSLRRGNWYDVDTKMFEAMFTLLCEYVENECAHITLMDHEKYTPLQRLIHRWVPRVLRRNFSRKLGLEYLDWMASVPECSQHQVDMNEMTKELYLWYNDEYPLMQDPYAAIEDPEFMFVDSNNIPTNDFSTPYNRNTLHPAYEKMLHDINNMEAEQSMIIDMKLEDLLAVRRSLWT